MRRLGLILLGLGWMVAGLWVGTQWSVPLVSAGARGPFWITALGYALYPPHQGLVWFLNADEATTGRLLLPVAIMLAGVFLGLMVLRLSAGRGRSRPPDVRISGARWATRDDLRRGGLL